MSRAGKINHVSIICLPELPGKLKEISWDMGTLKLHGARAAPKLPNLKSEPKFLNSHSKELECGMVELPIFNSIFKKSFLVQIQGIF